MVRDRSMNCAKLSSPTYLNFKTIVLSETVNSGNIMNNYFESDYKKNQCI